MLSDYTNKFPRYFIIIIMQHERSSNMFKLISLNRASPQFINNIQLSNFFLPHTAIHNTYYCVWQTRAIDLQEIDAHCWASNILPFYFDGGKKGQLQWAADARENSRKTNEEPPLPPSPREREREKKGPRERAEKKQQQQRGRTYGRTYMLLVGEGEGERKRKSEREIGNKLPRCS